MRIPDHDDETDDGHSFGKAIPGTEKLAGILKDTVGAFRTGFGIPEPHATAVCEGCGAPLSGDRHETVQCEYCDRKTRLP